MGFEENLSLLSPFSSKSNTTLSLVQIANFALLGAQHIQLIFASLNCKVENLTKVALFCEFEQTETRTLTPSATGVSGLWLHSLIHQHSQSPSTKKLTAITSNLSFLDGFKLNLQFIENHEAEIKFCHKEFKFKIVTTQTMSTVGCNLNSDYKLHTDNQSQ